MLACYIFQEYSSDGKFPDPFAIGPNAYSSESASSVVMVMSLDAAQHSGQLHRVIRPGGTPAFAQMILTSVLWDKNVSEGDRKYPGWSKGMGIMGYQFFLQVRLPGG